MVFRSLLLGAHIISSICLFPTTVRMKKHEVFAFSYEVYVQMERVAV